MTEYGSQWICFDSASLREHDEDIRMEERERIAQDVAKIITDWLCDQRGRQDA